MSGIEAITMPKWGLAMLEGTVTGWDVAEGDEVSAGQEIMEIETSKIANVYESPVSGVINRIVATEGETLPVGALLAVVAGAETESSAVDAYIADFQENFVPPEPDGDDGPAAQTIEVPGFTIRRLAMGPGTGTPIVLIHGFGADLESWAFNQADLAAERPVHAIDLPGHGGSGKDVGDGSVSALSAAVVAYMRHEGLSDAHLVGHSLGGAVAVEVARGEPDLVSALTLVAPAGFGPDIAGDFIDGFISQSRARRLRGVLEMLVSDPGLVTADMVEGVLRFKRLDGALDALKAVAAANFEGNAQRNDLRDRLSGLSQPVRVVWGSEDRVLSASHADGMEGARITLLEGAGHIVHMERAAEVNRTILG
ncbi:MAG: acetoin dehydrogenase dihydrolipoyllysine-residue acetyltransferase subunit [Rhodobacter sp.]|nr:acetoin dehydrogenase dihydrolipoyllysine-residue acetyltransferase subunit [Rhodobacter sp.]